MSPNAKTQIANQLSNSMEPKPTKMHPGNSTYKPIVVKSFPIDDICYSDNLKPPNWDIMTNNEKILYVRQMRKNLKRIEREEHVTQFFLLSTILVLLFIIIYWSL